MLQKKQKNRDIVAYQKLYHTGELAIRAQKARTLLEDCHLCPRSCRVNRLADELGKCRTGARAEVPSFGPHFGEESPLVGRHGSGTIFFTHCNLRCLFCQNYDISQLGDGHPVSAEELARMMLSLQAEGCHNINLVSPTHVVAFIIEALVIAAKEGLHIPLVYNTGGYDSLETLELLEGVVDIYMPDMKYADEKVAHSLSGIEHYPQVNQAAVKAMHLQVGDLKIDEQGIATRGLLVRHLVLPHGLAGTAQVLRFLAQEVSPDTYVNIMAQYRPAYQSHLVPQLSRPLTRQEFSQAINLAQEYGLKRLDRFCSSWAINLL